jgi:hypothetical protein
MRSRRRSLRCAIVAHDLEVAVRLRCGEWLTAVCEPALAAMRYEPSDKGAAMGVEPDDRAGREAARHSSQFFL